MGGNQVTQYLIRANIKLDLFGNPHYSYNTSDDDAASQAVNPGDQVAWFVQVLPATRPQSQPPYRLDFQDPKFFGTSSLVVPEGGYSPYLQVRTIKGQTKYTVTIHGVSPPDDPEIQTRNFPLNISQQVVRTPPRQIGITWDGIGGSTPALTVNGQAQHLPSPLLLHPVGTSNSADIVTFATSASKPFTVFVDAFFPNSNVPSPFDGSTAIDGSSGKAVPFTVATDALGYKYLMHFALLSDATTRSADFELDVTAWPPMGNKKSAAKPE